MNQDTVENRVRTLRLEGGIRQEDLAIATGVSRQTINSVERGRYTPSLALALKIAAHFSCPVEQVFWLAGDNHD